jgi:type IV conjugative transfer system coupling protein TraD
MSKDVKNFTRGGQITLHNLRMFFQIMDKVTWISAAFFLIATLGTSWIITTEYERYVGGEYAWSMAMQILNPDATTQFIQPNGKITTVKYSDVHDSPLVNDIIRKDCLKLIRALLIGLFVGVIVFFGISRWLRKRGESQVEKTLLKGDRILSPELTRKIIVNNDQNSDLSLATLPLIKNSETAHLLFHGTTGSGKSNAIKELLDQIRQRGDRAIIYDKSCNFLEEFFRPETDILLNPLDHRGRAWDLWAECRDAADFDNLAAAQIPMPLSTQDPFWVNAARTIFSAAAFEMRNDPDRSVIKLLRYLLTPDLDLIQTYLKGTEAESLVSDKIEKTAISIKSVLATYLKSLKYVKDGRDEKSKNSNNNSPPFSIRQWVQNDEASHWLFITSLGDRHETLKPLISAWIDVAVNALLSLRPDPKRRIWLILDELTSLQPLPYLIHTLSESRKFGGCVVIGIQNYAQLAKLYGQDGAREMSSLLNTRFMFRQPDPDMARWAASNFGEAIVDEIREGYSYGANNIRDGVSVSRVETRKPLVSYSEIMSLANLHAFVRLPGEYPVTRVDFQYKSRKRYHIGLLEREFDKKTLEEVDHLIDTCRKMHPFPVVTDASSSQISTIKKSVPKVVNESLDVLDII